MDKQRQKVKERLEKAKALPEKVKQGLLKKLQDESNELDKVLAEIDEAYEMVIDDKEAKEQAARDKFHDAIVDLQDEVMEKRDAKLASLAEGERQNQEEFTKKMDEIEKGLAQEELANQA